MYGALFDYACLCCEAEGLNPKESPDYIHSMMVEQANTMYNQCFGFYIKNPTKIVNIQPYLENEEPWIHIVKKKYSRLKDLGKGSK